MSGISLVGSYHTVEDVRAIGNGRNGITLFGGLNGQRGGIVRGSIASDNAGSGISVAEPSGSLVDGNVALHNGSSGIFVTCPSVVINNMAASNLASQIRLFQRTDADGITDAPCTANNNSPQ